jgi:gluconolactonase
MFYGQIEGTGFEVIDPRFNDCLVGHVRVERPWTGARWAEGPAWFAAGRYLVWSDIPNNRMLRYDETDGSVSVFRNPSNYSNGNTVDRQGRLVSCEHYARRVTRTEHNGSITVIADKFEGKRFNSPNDLALRANGDIYFTDPPYGLEGLDKSPLKELAWNGVYRRAADGKITLVIKDLTFPNGIGFSPDEKVLYVAVSDGKAPRIMAYDVQADGSVANGRTFFDAAPLRDKGRKGSCDGLKVDAQGNVWATGPGGVLVINPSGKHIGSILTNQATGNCSWGDDGSTLYITADMYLVRVKTKTKGAGWELKP